MNFSFKALHRSAAYWLVLTCFVGANLWSALQQSAIWPGCCDRSDAIGIPFRFLITGNDVASAQFFWTGLLLDVAITWTLAVIATWIVVSISSKQNSGQN